MPPLRQDAAAELRSRLNAAVDAYQEAWQEGEQRLADDANWQRLFPDERHTFRAEAGLLSIERPAVSTPEEIAAALTARSLGQWQDIAKAMPQRVAEALAEAAEKFTPKIQQIRIPAPGCCTIWGAGCLDCRTSCSARGRLRRRPGLAACLEKVGLAMAYLSPALRRTLERTIQQARVTAEQALPMPFAGWEWPTRGVRPI